MLVGDDPVGWLFRIERHFAVNQNDEDEKVQLASVCFEGTTLNWLQWLDSHSSITN